MNALHGRGILGLVVTAILAVGFAAACPDISPSDTDSPSYAAESGTAHADTASADLAQTLEVSGDASEQAQTAVEQLADEDVQVLSENPAMIQPGGNGDETSPQVTTGQTQPKGDDSQATPAPDTTPPQQEDKVSTQNVLIICGAVVVAVLLVVIIA